MELEPTTVRLRCWYIDRLTNMSTMVSEKKNISTQTCKTLLYHQQFQNVSSLQGGRYYPQMHCNSIGQTPPPRGVHRLLLYARARLELPHLVTGSPRTKTSPMLGWLQLSGWGTKTVQENKSTNLFRKPLADVLGRSKHLVSFGTITAILIPH